MVMVSLPAGFLGGDGCSVVYVAGYNLAGQEMYREALPEYLSSSSWTHQS